MLLQFPASSRRSEDNLCAYKTPLRITHPPQQTSTPPSSSSYKTPTAPIHRPKAKSYHIKRKPTSSIFVHSAFNLLTASLYLYVARSCVETSSHINAIDNAFR
ncbi:hypothetical protein L249_2012 [Ophiocordyceps polyrhachis-furcata BCC 54312]|uniref:Uncharacterized protein n=1 Tax=Ophiocordyceps polyrhachis-furcata BCC 54312 TaxID=1330021 RepID=A0A367LQQ2_9HYPO|nr:hypothetical protein L249_2012 [Ophiocordyceps polyrhachis-furcata BCC 54312]